MMILTYSSFLRLNNLVPRALFPLTSGRKTRALGALVFRPLVKGNEALGTRLGIRLDTIEEPIEADCAQRSETGCAEFGYFH